LVINASTGAVAQRMAFDEFGNVLANTNAEFQPFGYAGGFTDIHTSLVRFGARDYDAGCGRWTGKDPIGFGGGENFYTYCSNDPINYLDPYGLQEKTISNCPGKFSLKKLIKRLAIFWMSFLRIKDYLPGEKSSDLYFSKVVMDLKTQCYYILVRNYELIYWVLVLVAQLISALQTSNR